MLMNCLLADWAFILVSAKPSHAEEPYAEGESGNATPEEQRAILQDLALRSWRRSGGEGLADGGGSVQH
jgi:hypothetical protein